MKKEGKANKKENEFGSTSKKTFFILHHGILEFNRKNGRKKQHKHNENDEIVKQEKRLVLRARSDVCALHVLATHNTGWRLTM